MAVFRHQSPSAFNVAFEPKAAGRSPDFPTIAAPLEVVVTTAGAVVGLVVVTEK